MPTYVHKCPACPATAEATYPMSAVGNEKELPDQILATICCNPATCRHRALRKKEPVPVPHGPWPRVPQVPVLQGMVGGSTASEAAMKATDKQRRKLRSRLHFKNEHLPDLSKREKRNYARKSDPLHGDHVKGDHTGKKWTGL